MKTAVLIYDGVTKLEFPCSVISKDSIIHSTTSGIIIVNENECYLTNN